MWQQREPVRSPGGGGGLPATATPTFSPAGGTLTSPEIVTISDSTPGATIYYTTDGTAPAAPSTTGSTRSTGPSAHAARTSSVQVKIAANEMIQALAVKQGDAPSEIASASYTLASLGSGAQAVEHCAGGILPAGNVNTDLEIDGNSCLVNGKVNGGTYVYRNVNIWGGSSLNFADAKINFHAHLILVENEGSLVAGSSAPAVGPITLWLYGSADDGIPPVTCKSGPTCGVPPVTPSAEQERRFTL
jgi:hypothetical protein